MNRLVLTLLLTVAGSVNATGLKELLEAADRQNVDRRISIEQRERAAAEARQAWTALLPTFTATGAWAHQEPVVFNGIIIAPGDQFDATFRFDLPLIDTTRWFRASAAAHSSAAAAERDLAAADLARRQVIGAWYGYAAALKVRESALRSVSVAEAQLKLQEVREKAGSITELELLRTRAEVQRNRQVVADTENVVAVSRRTLNTLTGIDPGEAAGLPDDDLSAEPALEELEKNLDALPAVRAAEKDVQAASRISTAAKLAAVPVIGAQFTERITNATGFAGKTAIYNAGLNLTWRLEVPAVMAMDAQGHAQATAVLVSERARLAARDLIHADWQRLKAALIKVQAAQAQVEAARRADQVAHDRYAVGAATQVDVIQAERDLFGAEVGQIQSRTELASARLSLRLSSGRPLGL
jgi:outer membrane protein TolC